MNFAPTPETLWAVWGKSTQEEISTGWREPVYQLWLLASSGSEGRSEIRSAMEENFLAAMSMADISTSHALLNESNQSSWLPGWLPNLMGRNINLVQDSVGNQRWEIAGREEIVLLEGKPRDLDDLVKRGDVILEGPSYENILQDVRPVQPGHPRDWLHMVKSPETWGPIRHLINHE